MVLSFSNTQTLGDLNQDGLININDILREVNIILEIPPPPSEYEILVGDLNEDDLNNIQDIIVIVNIILGRDYKIYFVRNYQSTSELCRMREDGTGFEILFSYSWDTPWSERFQTVLLSPDKNYFLIEGGPAISLHSSPIWIVDWEGNFLHLLTHYGYKPIWYDNEHILYRESNTYTTRYNKNNIYGNDENLFYESSDSSYIIIFEWYDENNFLASEKKYLTVDGTGGWSDFENMIFNPASNEKYYLTDNNVSDASPRLSPDRQNILYRSKTPISSNSGFLIDNLFSMNLDTEETTQLTFLDVYTNISYINQQWHPENNKIIFSSFNLENTPNSPFDIFTLNLNTNEVDILTTTGLQGLMHNVIMEWR